MGALFRDGGAVSLAAFKSSLTDGNWPSDLQYDVAVSALNDRFTELDLDHPVPYFDDHADPDRRYE